MSSKSTFSYSSQSYSSSSTTRNGQTSGQRYASVTHSNPSGTTVRKGYQNIGEAPVEETRYYDAEGRLVQSLQGNEERAGIDGRVNGGARIEDVTDEQGQRDREYQEKMEDEYAKREGGA